MNTPEDILKQYWGYDSFRPLQREIIGSIMDGRDTLALLPTGGGKSLCFQVPALLSGGLCLVISPLIALMQDQVSRLRELDIPAECIHSGLPYTAVRHLLANAVNGEYRLLYISPERLQTQVFRDYLDEMEVTMLAVDEAHCISQWGHDFRPAYMGISVIKESFPRIPVLALTATATPRVQQDITACLAMTNPAIYKMSFARSNIFYRVAYSENKVADTIDNLATGTNIIYCRSRKQTEGLGKTLNYQQIPAAVYHAGLTRELRDEAQSQWMNNSRPVMVATTAFGMGIDKPDVRAVLHYDAPEHPEAYYQEAGRAGRDGNPSVATALYNTGDIRRLEDSTDLQYPPEAYLRQVYQAVAEYLQVPVSAQPDRYFPFDLTEFCARFRLFATNAIHALKLLEREGLWTMTDAVYRPATILFIADRHVLDGLHQMNARLGYVVVGLLRMYNSIFHFPTPVRETAIARQLRMQKDDVVLAIQQLAAMNILEYSVPSDGPQLFFHHYRVDSRHLHINMARINLLRQRHIARTDAMIAFLQNTTTCREAMLLEYFGEEVPADCGHCDVCHSKKQINPDRERLKRELETTIRNQGTMPIEVLARRYPVALKDTIYATIRQLADDRIVRINGQVVALY